ncbi:MAG TPA: cytochrome P450 [Bryobacteraceae bacterium]|nr:cytochrome P450 [Bryobacteraceae bacterium]
MADWLDLDRRAIRRLEQCSIQYGRGPILARIGRRCVAFVLHPDDVHRVLRETPYPFASATLEKRAALAHFEPKNVLLSEGAERAERRRWNEQALQPENPRHCHAGKFLQTISAEIDTLQAKIAVRGELRWNDFSDAWFRIVLRVMFGDGAREDDELLETMASLRRAANWAWLAPRQDRLLARLLRRICEYLERAEPGSLAAMARDIEPLADIAPEHQIPQWLFAFDSTATATFRALALLAAHREYARGVRQEVESRGSASDLPLTRSAVLESLRLWPTTPLLLRETRVATEWETGIMPPNTAIIIFTPFFHRNRYVDCADRFAPQIWLKDAGLNQTPPVYWPSIPFSEGPGICPGRQVALLMSTSVIAAILERFRLRLKAPHILRAPLPGTLNHFSLSFELRRLGAPRHSEHSNS